MFEPHHEPIRPGTRIKLIATSDEHTHLTSGARGTVDLVDGLGTIHVTWDDGTKLGLVPGIDFYEVVPPGDAPASGSR